LKHQTNRPYITGKHNKNKQDYQQLFKFLDILLIDIEMFGEYKLFVENLIFTLENNFSYLKKISDKVANRITGDDELKKIFDDFQKQYDYNIMNKTAMNNSKQLSRSTIMKQVYKHLNIKPTKQTKK
jgi:hypothetical protein